MHIACESGWYSHWLSCWSTDWCLLSGDNMMWFGDDPVLFTNWEDSSPSDLVPLETCVSLHSNTGKWENVSCLEEVENGVVCETDQSKIKVFFFSSMQNINQSIRLLDLLVCY